MNLTGKTALVTGGAHRLGKAITMALAGAGANVVINYHSSGEAAEATAAEARALGVQALTVQATVADANAVKSMVEVTKNDIGPIDVLVNSASLYQTTPLPTDDLSGWHRVTDILLHGAFYCANVVAPTMLESGEGAIINLVDGSAWQPYKDYAAHSVGKAALLALTRQLALELAPAVRVNAVSPGPVLAPPDFDEAEIRQTAAGTLLNRWGNVKDVTAAILFLLDADYITGEVITIDGGEQFGHRQ